MFESTSAPAGGNCALPLLELLGGVKEDELEDELLDDDDPEEVVPPELDPEEVVLDEGVDVVPLEVVPDDVADDVPDEAEDDPVPALMDEPDESNWVVVVLAALVKAVEPPHPVM
jgi:hypothetical protein